MGVRGLRQWLQIRAPPTLSDWKLYEGTKVGIDILPFLYNAKKQNKCIVTAVAILIEFIRSKGIEPIAFFDGKPPSEKKEVVKERAEGRLTIQKEMDVLLKDLEDGPDRLLVEHEIEKLQTRSPTISFGERYLIKKFLYTMGVRYVNSSGEADPLLAFWSQQKVLSAVLSTDMDMIARGVNNLIMPNEDGQWVTYSLSRILTAISLSFIQFRNLCVLMGTDYTSRVRTIPVRTAYQAIQSTTSLQEAWRGLRQKDTDLPALQQAVLLLDSSDLKVEKVLSEKEMTRWLSPLSPLNPEEFNIIKTTYFPSLHTEFLMPPTAVTAAP
jgi:flap endonuclease-1